MNFIMMIFFLLILLQLTHINMCHHNFSFYKHFNPNTVSGVASENQIAAKWKSSESLMKKIAINLMKTVALPLYQISTTTNTSLICSSSLLVLSRAVGEQKLWAIKMLDSSGKDLEGLLSGSATALGDYDACLNIKSYMFRGKYCLADVSFPLPPRPSFSRVEDEIPELKNLMQPETFGAELVKYGQYFYISQMRIALCVPSTCTASEVETITQKAFEYSKMYLDVHVPYCDVHKKVSYTTGEILIIVIFVTLLTIVTISTGIDLTLIATSEDFETSEKSLLLKYVLCFSAYTNFLKLSKKDNNPDTLTIFHGLRVITLSWIILCHTYFTVNFHAHDGLLHARDIPKGFWFCAVINGFLSVDTFFFMSSVLVSYLCMRIREKVNIPLFFFKRYWRLTPPLMLVTAFLVIAGRFGSGPLWRETFIWNLSSKCKRTWWWNMLYINNLFLMDDMCMIWTWYLSADTHLFLVCLYVIILLKRNVKKGLLALLLLLLIGVVWTAFVVIYYNLPPVWLQSFFNYDDYHIWAQKVHTPAQIHLPTVSIGMFVGYVLAMKKIHIPKNINIIGWIATGITMPSLVFGVYYWNQGNIPGVIVSAFYSSTQRVLWGLCLAFITLSCTTKKKGIAYNILSWDGFVPLSRLSYVAYLIHYLFAYFHTASMRSTYSYSHKNLLFLFFSVCTLTFTVACPLSLVIESPFMALEKVLTNREAEKKILPVGFINGMEDKCIKENT